MQTRWARVMNTTMTRTISVSAIGVLFAAMGCQETPPAVQRADAGALAEGGTQDAASSEAGTNVEAGAHDAGALGPGALISVELRSEVGVLLDELPSGAREAVVTELLEKPAAFWEQRARAQVSLAGYRLVFRNFFYEVEEPESTVGDAGSLDATTGSAADASTEAAAKGQLPLPPPELWQFELGEPARKMHGEHDLVTLKFTMRSTLFTNAASVPEAEPALAKIGGSWGEPFVFPLDPELLLQRTGYACMDEEEFPPNSVDGENVATFYDQDCEAAVDEDELTNSDCHITAHPDEDCVTAVERAVGSIETKILFTRVTWDPALAEQVRVGEITNKSGADLSVIGEGLDNHRVIYRYIEEDSCAVAEGCVLGTGWRRLLQFDASVKNLGAKALDIGEVDYYIENNDTPLGSHNIYEYSTCHNHYHFSHYGDFLLDTGAGFEGNKQAFCLQSTNRYSNNEGAPLTHPYGSCDYQGMQAGWGDDYGAGIECQWVDVTDLSVAQGLTTADLSFISNPDRFLCEGTPVLDANGKLTFEPSEFTTVLGDPVDRPVCEFAEDWENNNEARRAVEIDPEGGLITTECDRGQIGPLRDCGFQVGAGDTRLLDCTPGETVHIQCQTDAAYAVVRACEYSKELGTGVACVYRDAIANHVVEAASPGFDVTCPDVRGPFEPGGKIALYSGPLLPGDSVGDLQCTD